MRGEGGAMTDGHGTPTGTPITDPPVVQMISEDPLLRTTKLIAEAWDCDGLNQVGSTVPLDGRSFAPGRCTRSGPGGGGSAHASV